MNSQFEQSFSPSDSGSVASPASTGGAGVFFEQHVAAYWLAQLLVRGIAPILHDCTVVEVGLQTEHLSWHTDDFLIVCENGSGTKRKLAGQVKRTFTVSVANDDCKKAIKDFWRDFKNSQLFSVSNDCLALVIQRGTNTLLNYFAGLLDCARSSGNGAEFENRLTTPGFLNKISKQHFDVIRSIISESEGADVPIADVWSFLRVLHVLSLDLNTSTRQTEMMFKTLLAHTTHESDAFGAADATWNSLLREIGEGMPEARIYRYDDLSEVLRHRHNLLSTNDHRALRALSDHSLVILDGIQSTIGDGFHLERAELVQKVVEQLEFSQVVLLSGSAGSGKSAIAKDVLNFLAKNHFTFSFRAEEFAQPHLDHTLQNSQIPANANSVQAILASQNRKLLLVESVERLLEKSTRDAFHDLLTLVATDKSWQLLLTCRDYSTDLIRASFLGGSKVDHSVVTIPLLSDEDLNEVVATQPMLVRPLANPPLRRILRNPYVLKMALNIQWSEAQTLPQSEQEFRGVFWRDIIRVEHHASGGMPNRRERIFIQIALQRAQALSPYIDGSNLDSEALDNLRNDGLIVTPQNSARLVSTAHDVLEDWAILKWLEDQYLLNKDSIQEFSNAIGTYPAIRRTYRKWVTELVDRDAATAEELFQAAVQDRLLTSQFRDDTLVSLLRSPVSTQFLESHSRDLFDNDKQLLRQIVHLLRTACVTKPSWLGTSSPHDYLLFNIPDGLAWACVLKIIQINIQSFTERDHSLLLGLIEDWAAGVSWQTPYPEGSQAVAVIAYWLLQQFESYRTSDQQTRTLQVIAKIPEADVARFAALLELSVTEGKQNRQAEKFRKLIFSGLDGNPAARDMPERIVATAKEYLLCSDADISQDRFYRRDLELETLFGIKQHISQDFFPASAYHGPFLSLLRHHFHSGLTLIIDILNHSADWYAHPRSSAEYVEPPFELTLKFSDGTSRIQWCNSRLWNLYRGTSVGPYVLQSLLMALELVLLEIAEESPNVLDKILLSILQRGDSGALTGVVASVATAFPNKCGETLLTLLRSPICLRLDQYRLDQDDFASVDFSMLMPQSAKDKIYEDERREANTRPHRKHDLENAIISLQLGQLAPRVYEILDIHRSELPPLEEQDENDRIWRLALHRMDLRQYTITEDAKEDSNTPDGQRTGEQEQAVFRLSLNVSEPDIQEMTNKSAARLQKMNFRTSLLMWGLKVFKYEKDTVYSPAQWQQKLQDARLNNIPENSTEENEYQPGQGFVAAVCVRDHWEEMSAEERNWSVDVICSEVERKGNQWGYMERVQRDPMSADRPCAWVLPILLGKLNDTNEARVRQALAISLTHANYEVRRYAVWGIAHNLWAVDRELTLRCVNVLAAQALLVQQALERDYKQSYEEPQSFDAISAGVAAVVRQNFLENGAIPGDAYQNMDASTTIGAQANIDILSILGQTPSENSAIIAFQRLAQTIVQWWSADDASRRDFYQARQERDYETEAALIERLAHFVLRASIDDAIGILDPIVNAISRHPDEVYEFLMALISAEDRHPNPPQFWALWERFAQGVIQTKWIDRIDAFSKGHNLVGTLFLSVGWKEEVRHWRSLEGFVEQIHTLFRELPSSSIVFRSYLRFLYHIGEQALPKAFINVANSLQHPASRQALEDKNTVFMLEHMLQQYVYGRPLELKNQRDLRESVLFLLNILVDYGSSAAFRMRDDFVTPISST